jgi:hypothetical protein
LQNEPEHQLIVQEGYLSAAMAYNSALKHAINDIVVFVHQDVFLPDAWLFELLSVLRVLDGSDPNWGVLGCCGITQDRHRFGYLYTPGEGVIGTPMGKPERVRVLDEVLLVLRKSSRLTFSEQLPGFHFYGPDICLEAARRDMKCYAVSAFCIHNSRQYFDFPPEFYSCYRHMKHKWKSSLPIHTSCICISRFDWDVWKRRIKRTVSSATGGHLERGARLDDPQMLLKQIQAEGRV